MGMLPECDAVAAQRAIEWAQKFALLEIFLASQKEAEGIESRESRMIDEILRSLTNFGFWRERTTTSESPSMMKQSILREIAKEMAS
jgi:hypothetical protein